MRRQKKFYALGLCRRDLTPEENQAVGSRDRQRYGLNGFDVTPPPKPRRSRCVAPAIACPTP
jgi:hypothetical protein